MAKPAPRDFFAQFFLSCCSFSLVWYSFSCGFLSSVVFSFLWLALGSLLSWRGKSLVSRLGSAFLPHLARLFCRSLSRLVSARLSRRGSYPSPRLDLSFPSFALARLSRLPSARLFTRLNSSSHHLLVPESALCLLCFLLIIFCVVLVLHFWIWHQSPISRHLDHPLGRHRSSTIVVWIVRHSSFTIVASAVGALRSCAV